MNLASADKHAANSTAAGYLKPTLPEVKASPANVRPQGGALRRTGKNLALAIIGRIEAQVGLETQALANGTPFDLEDSNNRKCQSLAELNQAVKGLLSTDMDQEFAARLAHLRTQLAENMAMISMHLEAVREVSAMLSQSIQNAESDGTYDPRASMQKGVR